MSRKLQYFNLNGLAEPTRYILHYTKQEFEDVRHDFAKWPDAKIKATLPYGKFPVYEEDGRVLTQSLAIAKYAARGTDLIPTDPWQQAVVESAIYTLTDYFKNIPPALVERDPQKKALLIKNILDETVDFFFSRIDKQLKDNGGYFIGKLSWAEFVLCGLVESSNLVLGVELENNYPAVKVAMDRVRNLPGVKEHIAARGPYKLPI